MSWALKDHKKVRMLMTVLQQVSVHSISVLISESTRLEICQPCWEQNHGIAI